MFNVRKRIPDDSFLSNHDVKIIKNGKDQRPYRCSVHNAGDVMGSQEHHVLVRLINCPLDEAPPKSSLSGRIQGWSQSNSCGEIKNRPPTLRRLFVVVGADLGRRSVSFICDWEASIL